MIESQIVDDGEGGRFIYNNIYLDPHGIFFNFFCLIFTTRYAIMEVLNNLTNNNMTERIYRHGQFMLANHDAIDRAWLPKEICKLI